ncbi:MAG TPA: hypothetical protein VM099_12440 [Gemmatimonadaceae bacterium]|nr:hypothetical protein [Gemmatimonadaceae bacterium]
MKRLVIATLCCSAFVACDRDPASKVKIIDRPPAAVAVSSDSSATGANAQDAFKPPPPFQSTMCNVAPETAKGHTTFVAEGPCSFKHTADVKCRAVADDFHTVMLRQGPGEATVSVYLNVESYKGAGNYVDGQMFLTVQNKEAYYHWGSDSVHTVVSNGLKYVDVKPTRLVAEPPNTGTVMVSGRLWCASLTTEPIGPTISNG